MSKATNFLKIIPRILHCPPHYVSAPSTGKFCWPPVFVPCAAGGLVLAEPWLNELAGCSVVCLRGRAERRRAIISVPPPPSSDDASANAAANDNIGGDWQQGFCCLFVGRLDLSPHVADTDAASEAARELR